MPSIMKYKTVSNKERQMRVAKAAIAADAIGTIEKDTDTFILTFGQFSLIDSLVVILDQTGPADVTIGTWTAADAHLQKSAELIATAAIRNFRMIVDGSFYSRQPEYCGAMFKRFGRDCMRFSAVHAKFMLIRSDTHDIVVRTSMNMNENRRLENIEISESLAFAEFFQGVADNIFREVGVDQHGQSIPQLQEVQEHFPFEELHGYQIPRKDLNIPATSHTVKRPG